MKKDKPPSGLKVILEFAPLVLFFIANSQFGIYYGTGVLVIATLISMAILWLRERYIPKILALGCVAVVLFGGLTLVFEDDTFIKIKPTVVSLIIASILVGGVVIGRNPLKAILGDTMKMNLSESAWRGLTRLWVAMFVSMAVANELAWRNLSTDGWVSFKVFGLTGLSLAFGVVMAVFLSRHGSDDSQEK